jgi:hypothetical protein
MHRVDSSNRPFKAVDQQRSDQEFPSFTIFGDTVDKADFGEVPFSSG